MLRCAYAVVCTLAVLTGLATPAIGADYTVESADADTGAVTAKDAKGKSVTLMVEKGIAGALSAGQTVSIDAAKGTMLVTVPVRVQGAGRDGDAQATGNAASSAKNTKKAATGSGTVVKPDVTVTVFKAGDTKSLKGDYGKAEVELMPGKYVVAVSQKKVADVEIASRQDTTLSVGGLRINAGKDTRFDVFDADKKTKLAGDYGAADVGLPVGTYHVQIGGAMEEVKVEEGKVTEF
jgi:hypothetical protein